MPDTLWSAALELHPFAAVQIDLGRSILRTNRRAQDLWSRRPDLFRADQGRVDVVDTEAQRLLVQRLAAATTAVSHFAIAIGEPELEMPHWLVVRACPNNVAGFAPAAAASHDPTFLISFRLADDFSRLVDPDRLVTDLGLTPTEAKLAAALAEGSTVRDFAEREGAQTTTVRWHLKNACRKLGCAGQKDLVRTILLVSI